MSYKKHYTPDGVKLVEEMRKKQEEYVKENKMMNYGTASYAANYKTGISHVTWSAACSAAFRRTAPKHLLYIVHRAYQLDYKGIGLTKEVTDAYYHWLMNESPWKDAFLTKEVLYARRYGMEMDTSKNGGVVYGATIACRIWEWASVVVAWHALVKQGVGKNLAFLIGHYIDASSPEDVLIHDGPIQHNHTAIQPSFIANRYGYLARFAKGQFLFEHTPENAFFLEDQDDILDYRANNQFTIGKAGIDINFPFKLKAMARESVKVKEASLNPFATKKREAYDLKAFSQKLVEFESTLEVKE